MRKQRVLLILICFVFLNISMQFSVFGKDNWHEVKTKNFTLIGNAKEKQIKKVGIKLEQFRESIKRLVPTLSKNSPISTTVIVFKNGLEFRPYKPINAKGEITEWVAGYFQAGFDVNYIALAYESKGSDAFQTIFHEYAHSLIDYNIGRSNIPTWLNEGLAEYYDQFSVKDDRLVRFGGRNNSHLRLLNEQSLMPLEKFFAIDYKALRIKKQNEANLYYSQAWALTHFLMRGDGGKRKNQLDTFINLLSKNKPIKEAFREAFRISYGDLQIELEAHIKSKIINKKAIKFEKGLTNNMQIKSRIISKAEVYANLGDLLYQRKRFAEAKRQLDKALKINPNLSFANATYGLVLFKQEKYLLARKHLLRAINSNKADYLSYYRNAFFLSQEVLFLDTYVSNYSDKRAKEMRELLTKSIVLNPRFPASYRLLGFISLVRNEKIDGGIINLKKALNITPNKQSYLLELAHLYQRKKDFENAKSIASRIVKNPLNEDLFSKANFILDHIKLIKREEENAKLNEKLSKDKNIKINQISIAKKPRVLSEFELERNLRQTESEIISEVLRKPNIGEKRIIGKISKITCQNNRVLLEIAINSQTKTLQSKSLNNIKLKTYTSKMKNGVFGCDLFNNEVSAVFIYKPLKENGSDILGDVISIEFVPNNFVLSIEK